MHTRAIIITFLLLLTAACWSSGRSGILGPVDETAEAIELVNQANDELQKIKVLYTENETKRAEIKKALETNNAEEVKTISDHVVYAINDGFDFGKAAVDKIGEAQDLKIHPDFRDYLQLKEDALRKQMAAFEEYRQAARALRDNYDPNNSEQREKVKTDFKNRSEKYAELMEKARDQSSAANELYIESLRIEAGL